MCIEILKNPAGALAKAKKVKDYKHVATVLLEAAAAVGVAFGIAAMSITQSYAVLAAVAGTMFSLAILFMLLFALVVHLSVRALGQSKYVHALTAVVYGMVHVSAGMLAAAALLYVPSIGEYLAVVVLFPFLAASLAVLYRGLTGLLSLEAAAAFAVMFFSMLSVFLAVFALRLLVAVSTLAYYAMML
ncbi:MAG: hypothetical protein HYY37_02500 [Candidatus Aenigmarchaeota archaeon]|nr:hypothetical protein [Candidatus Aenigmarchaeota archaeon]